ncbi:tetratricopeptide repeat protein [Kumtagia ephedrae]|uniref:O-linked GlcNAc transferase n=1 Tax=Kumtagia ephedrae TaxID=2116701 RepID=A0A2P7RX89_9HYPH|nr:tetratricopeptide repeat protein [Mesorhizobium ephedrae]PSJ54847.1 O-linked GlcNAc transferase [Mesorhizobium ephedrae]
MSALAGNTICLIGALASFPRRAVRREVERQGGVLRGSVTRGTTHVVFGHRLIESWDESRIEAAVERERSAGRQLLSENGFLRLLGLAQPAPATVARQVLIEQAGLPPAIFDLLALFDAFERDVEPFTFRDLILAKKYVMLLVGTSWSTIVRSIRRSPSVGALASLALHAERSDAIYAQHAQGGVSELDGQVMLPLATDDVELEALRALADEAEAQERHEQAAAIYREYLAHRPGNAVVHFNRGNCLRHLGRLAEAGQAYMGAIKRDPKFVEAWFNLAAIDAEQGRTDAARRSLSKAIALDAGYADAVYNLASLEYEAGNLAEARRWWLRYLELDPHSEWGRIAARGIQFVDLAQKNAS